VNGPGARGSHLPRTGRAPARSAQPGAICLQRGALLCNAATGGRVRSDQQRSAVGTRATAVSRGPRLRPARADNWSGSRLREPPILIRGSNNSQPHPPSLSCFLLLLLSPSTALTSRLPHPPNQPLASSICVLLLLSSLPESCCNIVLCCVLHCAVPCCACSAVLCVLCAPPPHHRSQVPHQGQRQLWKLSGHQQHRGGDGDSSSLMLGLRWGWGGGWGLGLGVEEVMGIHLLH